MIPVKLRLTHRAERSLRGLCSVLQLAIAQFMNFALGDSLHFVFSVHHKRSTNELRESLHRLTGNTNPLGGRNRSPLSECRLDWTNYKGPGECQVAQVKPKP
ncbi:hypothetical protein SUGI_1225470 [Cryptomeria japonica]|uniref:Uncharacterized protein n=1 Tax=Cryptomeria japonica TaxID=3369 RepID=A0AAD3NPV9_CRYJA|nr:hypothetical protein SUGI_1225470 [Cryptomeria japonica]